MKFNVVAPSVGESITEVSILKWAKKNGQAVKTGEKLLEIESDKATVEIVAEKPGVLQILKAEGERILIGAVIAVIDDAATATVAASAPATATSATAAPAASAQPARPATSTAAPSAPATGPATSPAGRVASFHGGPSNGSGPAANKIAAERGIDTSQIAGSGRDGRVTKGDVLQYNPATATQQALAAPKPSVPSAPAYVERPGDRRVPMSMLRQRIAERLVQAQHTAAILTTFNEADMTAVMELRAKHKEAYKAKHGINLGFMAFFSRAVIEAFKVVPEVNAMIDGRDVIYHDYVDLGIAVGSDRGLVVPVIREAHKLSSIDIEKKLGELAIKARDGKLSMTDLTGGTFTISNGGTYGSLLSTPILNPPQSAILGMHKIQERPIAVDGKVVIRPMMYLALSYDHRIIDGKGAVTFLVTVKDLLEHPEKLGMQY
jgi:2-oxoglutarate dehydrogenase E2 component (dihydrolipoamide succinyltransferase)